MTQVTERPPNGASSVTCREPDCSSPVKARGWCPMHYMRWRRTGDPGCVRKPGPPASQARATIREIHRSDFSERTFDRYMKVFRLRAAGWIDQEQHEAAVNLATRPNGSFNVSRMVRVAEFAAIQNMIRAEGGE